MLFGTALTFDNPAYYNRCARARTYNDLMNPTHELEHTKPIFNELKLLNVYNLYNYHIAVEIFNIIKFRQPYSLFAKLQLSTRTFSLIQPRVRLSIRLDNFLYKSALIWNASYPFIFKKELLTIRGIQVPGSTPGSDITISGSIVKNKLKGILLIRIFVLTSFFSLTSFGQKT